MSTIFAAAFSATAVTTGILDSINSVEESTAGLPGDALIHDMFQTLAMAGLLLGAGTVRGILQLFQTGPQRFRASLIALVTAIIGSWIMAANFEISGYVIASVILLFVGNVAQDWLTPAPPKCTCEDQEDHKPKAHSESTS